MLSIENMFQEQLMKKTKPLNERQSIYNKKDIVGQDQLVDFDFS